MNISTVLFGEIQIQQQDIIQFPLGIPGFPEEQRFVLLPVADTPFYSLQSVTNKIHFIVMNPFQLFKDYEFQIPDPIIEFLELDGPETVQTWVIVTLREEISQSTANMQAPIIINSQTRKGRQLVLNQYVIRQPIFTPTPVALLG